MDDLFTFWNTGKNQHRPGDNQRGGREQEIESISDAGKTKDKENVRERALEKVPFALYMGHKKDHITS